jgi:uncharacterized protein
MTLQTREPRTDRSPAGGSLKGAFYRQCRLWHAYLSAFAFIALMFFSATGILLNHPDWFADEKAPETTTIRLAPEQVKTAKSAADVPRALLEMIEARSSLRGAFSSGDVENGVATIRLQGVKGASDIVVDLASGAAEISVQRSGVVAMLNELHRGAKSGQVWRALIDIAAGLILIMSLIGYVLFFSLRFRLRTSLILTGISLAGMLLIFTMFVS